MALGNIRLPVCFGHPVEEGHEVDEVEVVDIFVERQCRVDNGSVGHEQAVLDVRIELCELVKQFAGLVDPLLPDAHLKQVVGAPKHAEVGVWALVDVIELQDGAVSLFGAPLPSEFKNVSDFHRFYSVVVKV